MMHSRYQPTLITLTRANKRATANICQDPSVRKYINIYVYCIWDYIKNTHTPVDVGGMLEDGGDGEDLGGRDLVLVLLNGLEHLVGSHVEASLDICRYVTRGIYIISRK